MPSPQLATLTAEVAEIDTVIESAIQLFGNLSALIVELKNDPVQLQNLANMLDTKGNQLAAAVVAHTPVADVPPVEPPVE